MGNCITENPESTSSTINIDCNDRRVTRKTVKKEPTTSTSNSNIIASKYDQHHKKILESKGQLELPCGLEWFPTGHGHKRVKKLFDLKDELGCGVTASVHSAVYKGQKCAIKRIQKNTEWSVALVTSEGRILRNLKHNGIINLIDMYFDDDYYYFIMEKANFDLFSWINVTDLALESTYIEIVRNLFQSLKYMHDHNIVHRDLKPENIVFCKNDNLQPKIIDFGDAMYIKDDKTYDEYVGTPQYMGKERFVEHKGWQLKKSDIFALGVITYEMITRERCFDGETQKQIYKQVSKAQYQWPNEINISKQCKDFVRWCLQPEAKDRPSCEQALSHPWLKSIKTEINEKGLDNSAIMEQIQVLGSTELTESVENGESTECSSKSSN